MYLVVVLLMPEGEGVKLTSLEDDDEEVVEAFDDETTSPALPRTPDRCCLGIMVAVDPEEEEEG